jgi:putative endonuclease
MRFQRSKNYYTYIITNPGKTVLYTGMTNNLRRRLSEHFSCRGKPDHFASRYCCYKLLYFEMFDTPMEAIHREKEIKDLKREKKLDLIRTKNPGLKFLLLE